MVTIVPSRFAGLRIEDDDEECPKPKQNQKAPANQKSTAGSSSGSSSTKQGGNHQHQKKKPKKPKKSSNDGAQNEQWSKWQQKDTEIVESHYEKDLEQALMLSKLEFEANKTKILQAEREAKQSAKPKKSRPLSLQQFQSKIDKDSAEKETERQRELAEAADNKKFTFFEQIDRETKQTIQKEQYKSLVSNRAYNFSEGAVADENKEPPDSPAEESSELEKLKAENATLRAELDLATTRLKKACSMLKAGEMKDKAALLIEIAQLKKVHEEMAKEMTALSAELQQEKSKAGSANHERGGKERAGGKKSVRFDASTELHNGRDA
ncbi:G kinase-anchoring protein 1-A-like [Sabethes cyaneus]|uniref:G kinase-anchoring protein 1-A-like n=1 Tax=Sabethes cyaneus TaxID=53552 RepID=UPI00237DB9F7|nr:G kinase-anchoring protein 1-A-like [Sabethes cyaneus]